MGFQGQVSMEHRPRSHDYVTKCAREFRLHGVIVQTQLSLTGGDSSGAHFDILVKTDGCLSGGLVNGVHAHQVLSDNNFAFFLYFAPPMRITMWHHCDHLLGTPHKAAVTMTSLWSHTMIAYFA